MDPAAMTLLVLAFALTWECGSLALATDDCHREAAIWARVSAASAIEWRVVATPEAA